RCAQRLDRFKPSATLAINAAALELKAKGIAITSLAIGEPDFAPPRHVSDAAKAAIDAGHSRYTDVAGIAALRQAVAGYYQRLYKVTATENQVLIGNGGKQILYNLLLALINPGDEVLIPAPYWLSYPDMVLLVDGVPVSVFAGPEQAFKVTPAQLEAARTPRTRALIFNSPSNPTGAVYTRAETDAILTWAMEHELFVIADEIYDQLVYAPAEPYSVSSWWQRFPERCAVVNGLSKTFAMTGWRVGYVLAHADLVQAMATIQSQTTSNVCAVAQHAGVAALNGSYADLHTMRAAFIHRRDAAWAEIATWPGVACPKPDGAFYLFLDLRALFASAAPDETSLCATLLREANVAVVPGSVFGAPGCIRLSYAVREDELMAALVRMKHVLGGAGAW
ncbi:MAG: pyridoxal phosphate-dependent aminotransferase, partial [Deltaproteobacteria bacterium]|nr:pyridoxal phosphate-dependent aminotransferase [Deltaproteobacteria bacterium]